MKHFFNRKTMHIILIVKCCTYIQKQTPCPHLHPKSPWREWLLTVSKTWECFHTDWYGLLTFPPVCYLGVGLVITRRVCSFFFFLIFDFRSIKSKVLVSIPCTHLHHRFFFSVKYFFNLRFNWRIIDLQNFVVFCQTSTWISHRYPYIPSLLNLPFPVLSHHSRLILNPCLNFLSHTANSHWVSILHVVM